MCSIMERFFRRKISTVTLDNSGSSRGSRQESLDEVLANLQADPGLRIQMMDYSPNFRDEIRRAYLQKGPCQPRGHTFLLTNQSGIDRRFIAQWFDEFDWLEYSISKDAAYCFYCYLFKSNFEQAGSDVFTEVGFKNWKKGREKFSIHVGPVGSAHNRSREAAMYLMNQKSHIETVMGKQSDQARVHYRTCLNAAIDCTKFLLRQGLSFRGNDESATSGNRGNYLELLHFLADHDEKVKAVVFEHASRNLKLVAPSIQKDLVSACAMETISNIMSDMKDRLFSIMVDDSRDISIKEQMAMVLRYVDDKGQVIERFVGVQHVAETTSSALKDAIDAFFSFNKLSFSKLRGQGYDGASNMRGEFNGLKTRILREQPCAFYIHCFAHQLQLALIAVAKKNADIATFFTSCNSVVNIIGASCKRRDSLREQLQKHVMEAFENDSLQTGRGLNQESSLKRAGDTRWNSHYGTLISLISMFPSIVNVLELIVDDRYNDSVGEANRLLGEIQSFEFVFHLFLMRSILGITNILSKLLQKKDQEIVSAMALVKACKERLHHMRNNGFDIFVDQVYSFCASNHIEVPDMDATYVARGRSRRNAPIKTYHHHYRVELFIYVIDEQLVELEDRFNEVNSELLLCLACLSPENSFAAFDIQKLLRLAQFYPHDFSNRDLLALEDQLWIYVHHMRSSSDFSELKGIGDLAKKLVEKGLDRTYTYVYLLITLALVLPVATASMERAFSAMNIIKGPLRNKMGDQWLSDSLVVYIEKDVFSFIDNETIMTRFQNMKSRRGQL